MNVQDAVNNLRGIRRSMSRQLSRDAARAVGVALLAQAVNAYGDPALYSAYSSAVGTAMNHNRKKDYKVRMCQDKQRLRDRLKPTNGSFQYHLYNAICGLENLYGKGPTAHKFGLSLILNHLSAMDQDSVASLSDHISMIAHAVEADETRALMENTAQLREILTPAG